MFWFQWKSDLSQVELSEKTAVPTESFLKTLISLISSSVPFSADQGFSPQKDGGCQGVQTWSHRLLGSCPTWDHIPFRRENPVSSTALHGWKTAWSGESLPIHSWKKIYNHTFLQLPNVCFAWLHVICARFCQAFWDVLREEGKQ